MSEDHFDPATYAAWVRHEIPYYDDLQEAIADATAAVPATAILDLGTGTGETLARVVPRHPAAHVVGVDESAGMLAVARDRLVDYDVTLEVADLRSGGRFVLGDVVLPADEESVVIPLTEGWDKPSTVAEQLGWLADAGFEAVVVWQADDLALFTADLL
jgi:tRNA (cmo5U34)-methyltransferase